MGMKSHFTESLQWNLDDIDGFTGVAAAIAFGVPAVAGALSGNLPAGLSAAFGAMMVAGVGLHLPLRVQLGEMLAAVMPVAVALVVAVLIGGHGALTDVAIVALGGAVSLVGGLSRPLARGTTVFLLCLVIFVAFVETAPVRSELAVLVAVGLVWAMFTDLAVGAITRRVAPHALTPDLAPSWAQRIARWRRTLGTFAGWQYFLRLVLGLAAAAVLKALWPDHHLHWIALTVALLTERTIDAFPVRTTQRALGTALGVGIAALLFGGQWPAVLTLVIVIALAALRPLLRTANYLAYAVVMTLLLVAVMDAGTEVSPALLIDRLGATLIGASLVICGNFAVGRLIPTTV